MKRMVAALTLCALLAGCSALPPAAPDTPAAAGTSDADEPAQEVRYFVCRPDAYELKSSVMSSDGRVVAPLDEREKQVVTDREGNFCYILTTRSERVDDKNTICHMECLDGQGKALCAVSLPVSGVDWGGGGAAVNPGAPADRLRFSVTDENGQTVYDTRGEQVLRLPDNQYLVMANEYLLVAEGEGDVRLYDLDGGEIETERDYRYMGYFEGTGVSPHFALCYEAAGGMQYDLLAADGTVLLRDLRNIVRIEDDYVIATRGFSYGIMDLKGNWITKDSIFTGLED